MSDEGPLHMAKTSTETDLEKSGNIYALQKYRYEQWWEYPTKIDFSALLETEVVLREIAQREMAVRDKLNRIIGENIEKGKGNRNVTLVQGLQGKLSKLAKQYWLLERLWWEIRSAYKDCPMTRGFDLWRSHPKWYMHQVLSEDCAGRGGCCGRGCGCCSNRQTMTDRKLAAGHCTVECSCCEQARGFELDSEQKLHLQEKFKPVHSKKDPRCWYSCRMFFAATLGLKPGNTDNPFHLIEELPPRYAASSTP